MPEPNSLCYGCARYDWAIVVWFKAPGSEWEHICAVQRDAGDSVTACPDFIPITHNKTT